MPRMTRATRDSILRFAKRGLSNAEIAEKLGLEQKKVNKAIYRSTERDRKRGKLIGAAGQKESKLSGVAIVKKMPGKMVVIVTSDVEQIKKLITEL